MIRVLYSVLIFMAVESAYAVCAAFITHTDPYPAAIVLALTAAAWLGVRHMEQQRDERLARGREQVWRDREAGL
ncbi:hypothetical protein [Mycobacterium palustre]|uniref:UsfY protein n=1 Tax=Mycobacterium palustre TaxID=153971 RepID=A0A1X1ZCD6_9MYCO|nr:hypothetical protein [Mycobacterium palustre]MCV7102531.1 hypothetical protein [Mycobacterium palustre]ORW20945.1 hypothetical protein AWC19_14370 [Mycobacterium palustre]